MRQSTKHILLASVTLVATGVIYMLGMGDALAGEGKTIAEMAQGDLSEQIGGSGQLMKQGANVLGASMGIGGAYKLYANAKENFKDGAKGFVVPAVMALTGGAVLAAPYIIQSGTRSIGATGTETIDQTTGGVVGW